MTDEKRDDIRPSVTELSHKQTTNRMKDLGEEIRRVAEKDELSDKDDEYLRELKSEFETLERHARKLERQALVEKIDYATGNPLTAVRGDNPRSSNEADRDIMDDRQIEEHRGFSNPWDLSEMRTFNRSKAEVGASLPSVDGDRADAGCFGQRPSGSCEHHREVRHGRRQDRPPGAPHL